jgi:hypothetical protein
MWWHFIGEKPFAQLAGDGVQSYIGIKHRSDSSLNLTQSRHIPAVYARCARNSGLYHIAPLAAPQSLAKGVNVARAKKVQCRRMNVCSLKRQAPIKYLFQYVWPDSECFEISNET